ncbi:MAG: hypothetical protein IJX78_04375 [Bacilli bacterium]|nr:hypothetical protein [Bacilli bacterium]
MFNNRKPNKRVYPQPYFNQEWMDPNNNYSLSILETEINELKRQNINLSKRLNKIENYLGIRNEDNDSSLF